MQACKMSFSHIYSSAKDPNSSLPQMHSSAFLSYAGGPHTYNTIGWSLKMVLYKLGTSFPI